MKSPTLASMVLVFALLAANASAASFQAGFETDTITSCPCTANEIRVDVENMYRRADTLGFSLQLPAGWSKDQGFVRPELMLGSGESDTVTVYITPPCDCEPATYQARLDIKSYMTGDEVSRVIDITTMKCHYVSMDLDENYRDVCEEKGDDKSFDVMITNEGKFGETFTLSTDREWANFADSSIDLGPGEQRTVELSIDPPEGLSDMQGIGLSVKSATSYARAGEQIELNIKDCYGFEARLLPSGHEAENGGQETGADAADNSSGQDGVTGMATADYPWETMLVAIIIIVVVLAIFYIIVRGKA